MKSMRVRSFRQSDWFYASAASKKLRLGPGIEEDTCIVRRRSIQPDGPMRLWVGGSWKACEVKAYDGSETAATTNSRDKNVAETYAQTGGL